LRAQLDHRQKIRQRVFYPDLEFCTDNGAMIAFAGALAFAEAGSQARLSLQRQTPLDLQLLNYAE